MEALKLGQDIRHGIALALIVAVVAACSSGEGVTMQFDDVSLPIVQPREAAERLVQYAEEIDKVLGSKEKLDRVVVLPIPCGRESSQKEVPGRNEGLHPWWVSYSPYAESIDTFVELDSAQEIQPVLARLRDGLQKAGWRIVEYTTGMPSKSAILKAAAPEAGYGATFEGIAPTAERSPRIGVNVSSPCLRHPEAE